MKFVNETGLSHILGKIKTALAGKADSGHTHSAATTSVDGFLSAADKTKLNGIATGANKTTVDSSLSSTSTNPVQNKVINSALGGKVPTTRKVNGKALSADITLSAADVGADASGAASTAEANAKSYTDGKISALVGEGAAETLDTIGEIAAAIEDNQDMLTTLNSAIGNKANASDLTSHTGNKNNPHGVTLSQLGVTATAAAVNEAAGLTALTNAEIDTLWNA